MRYRDRLRGRPAPFACPLCPEPTRFWSKGHLNEHLILDHGWTLRRRDQCRTVGCDGSTVRDHGGYPTLELCADCYRRSWMKKHGRTNGHANLGYVATGRKPKPTKFWRDD